MFTGIIEATARVLENTGHQLLVERPAIFDDIKLGSSISVSGVCLSIVSFDASTMRFDVIDETLAKTKLGSLKAGDLVNVERAMLAGARLDGHIVQGHVENVGFVQSSKIKAQSSELAIRLPKDLVPFVVVKGSIALDGVSLTVADVQDDLVTVALIPHTLANTTLGSAKEGDRVNIETDILLRMTEPQGPMTNNA